MLLIFGICSCVITDCPWDPCTIGWLAYLIDCCCSALCCWFWPLRLLYWRPSMLLLYLSFPALSNLDFVLLCPYSWSVCSIGCLWRRGKIGLPWYCLFVLDSCYLPLATGDNWLVYGVIFFAFFVGLFFSSFSICFFCYSSWFYIKEMVVGVRFLGSILPFSLKDRVILILSWL